MWRLLRRRSTTAVAVLFLLSSCTAPAPLVTRTSNPGSIALPSPTVPATPSDLASPTSGARSPSPGPRVLAAAAYDEAREEVIVFGGQGAPTPTSAFEYLGDTWAWNGSSWIGKQPLFARGTASGPSPRFSAAAAYDAARRVIVLFGGLPAGTVSGETWTWDGRSWTQRQPTTNPPARYKAAMAYDAARRTVVMFGGQTDPSIATPPILSDTWTWDGVDWHQESSSRAPSPRVFASMAYDAERQRVVLFGGDTGQGQVSSGGFDDTWTWDGSEWTRVSITGSPPMRSGASLAYDGAHAVLVLFGGISGREGKVLNDTWQWDGSAWKQYQPRSSPPAGLYAVLVYDAARRLMLLYGGSGCGQTNCSDSWTWDGIAWSRKG